jgi:TldD protein
LKESGASEEGNFLYADPFEVDDQSAQRLLGIALARGGDHADLFFESTSAFSLTFEGGKVRQMSRHIDKGVGVRVLRGDSSGFAYTEELTEPSIRRACETAACIASQTPHVSAQEVRLQALGPSRYQAQLPLIDSSFSDRMSWVRRADAAARAADPRVTQIEVSLAESVRHVRIVRADGLRADDIQPMLRFSIQVVVDDGEQQQRGMESGGGRKGVEYFDEVSPELHAERAVKTALTLLDAVAAPAGEYPVVLKSGDSGILLHEAVGHGLEADFNRKGTSTYTGRIGKSVASELCTVVDDPTVAGDRGAINVDDEGNQPQRRVLIDQGQLADYMHDSISAKHYGAKAGSGRRESFRHLPMPRMSNTYLLPGQSSHEEIIRSVKKGIYCVSFSGGQVNISNGDFVFSTTEAYLIEDGKISAPLKDVNLIGNGPDALGQVDMVADDFELSDGRWTCGKDGQSVPVGVGMPTLRIAKMTIGGSQL